MIFLLPHKKLYSRPCIHSRTFSFTQTFAPSAYARKQVSLNLICRYVGQKVEQNHHAQNYTRRSWRPPGSVLVFVGVTSVFRSCASAYMQISLYTQPGEEKEPHDTYPVPVQQRNKFPPIASLTTTRGIGCAPDKASHKLACGPEPDERYCTTVSNCLLSYNPSA